MSRSMMGFSTILDLIQGAPAPCLQGMGQNDHVYGSVRFLLTGCIFLSLLLHGLGGWLADFRPVRHVVMDKLVLLEIEAPPVLPVPTSISDEAPKTPTPATPSRIPHPVSPPRPGKTSVLEAKTVSKNIPVAVAQSILGTRNASLPTKIMTPTASPEMSAKDQMPVGQIIPSAGVMVLANESGQDALKHGSEARFMHGVATEEFVEENYIGEYSMGKSGKVWIEDDRAGSGHLILHAEVMGLRRPLFRFNRFIYIYGESPDSPDPILGSVTFFSDGYHIHQFLWQHNSSQAYFPRRK